MNFYRFYQTRFSTLRIAALVGVMLSVLPLAVAQEEEDEEVFELSPFEVDASGDHGYYASNTLSGTRLNTENRYVGASVTVITHQLLEDLGINDFEEVLDWVPNSSPATSGAINDDPNGNEAIWGLRYKVRGFKLTGFSRDFFITRVAPDSYNTERMTFSRGPNSVLFGVAEPGGVTNAVSARAQFANRNQIGMRFDTWDSKRYHASFNREVIEDKLAVRVAALSNDHRNHRNPWHNKSDRYYGTLTFKPFKNTTIRANHEQGDTERINVRSWAAGDAITVWEAAGSQDIPAQFINPTARATVPERTALFADYGLQEVNGSPFRYVMTSGNIDEITYYSIGREFSTARNSIPGLPGNANSAISFTDNSIVPMNANVLGSGNKAKEDFSNSSLFLEQKITDNLFVELAYNRQDTDKLPDFSTGRWDLIYKDLLPTIRLLDGNTGPNPNYGKLYLLNLSPTTFAHTYDDETLRAMVSYELNLKDRLDSKLGTILGHHNFAAMYETFDESFIWEHFLLRNAMSPTTPGTPVLFQNYIDVENGQFDSLPVASMFPRVWHENREDLPEPDPSGISPYWYGNNNSSTNTTTETASKMFAMQNYFWDNKIVLTFGWRDDDVDKWTLTRLPRNPDTGLNPDYKLLDPKEVGEFTTTGGSTDTRGIVVTPIPWLGFFYNESNNFRPANAGQLDIFGNNLPNESGEGKDYGLKLFLWDGKVTGSLAFFETTFKNQSTRGPLVGPVGQFVQPMTQSRQAINDYYEELGTPELSEKYNEFGWYGTGFFATQDLAAEGWEFSITANPTRNWRIMFNMSKQENVTSNVAPQMKAWAKHIRKNMTDPSMSDPILLGLETNLLKPDGVNYNTVADNLDLSDQRIVEIASLEGFADQRQPEKSANLTTAYDFKDGRLKNFTLGGSFRWRGKAAIGYRFMEDGSGALDATRPFWNEATEWFGMFVTYRRKLTNNINMRLQLNIDNLLDDETQNPLVSRDVNGQQVTNRWLLPEGRSFALTATFDF